MKTHAFLVHALSPVHAGTGHSAGIIDLPIARMKATGVPFVPGSSIKGVLRDLRKGLDEDSHLAVFGPDQKNAADHAGALAVGDARLLALPVRSFKGTFAWVSSPLLLALARRDLGQDLPVPMPESRSALHGTDCICVHETATRSQIFLEDLDLPTKLSEEITSWSQWLAPSVSPSIDIFSKRFVVVDDDTMAFLWTTATQVDARVRVGAETRTVSPGALWLEESLPPESLLIGLFVADRSRRRGLKQEMSPQQVVDFAVQGEEVLQLGGKATVGRGRCRLVRVNGREEAQP